MKTPNFLYEKRLSGRRSYSGDVKINKTQFRIDGELYNYCKKKGLTHFGLGYNNGLCVYAGTEERGELYSATDYDTHLVVVINNGNQKHVKPFIGGYVVDSFKYIGDYLEVKLSKQ